MSYNYQYLHLDLTSSARRRVGLSRTGSPLLHQGARTKSENKEATMPPKTATTKAKGKGPAKATIEKSGSKLNTQKEEREVKVQEKEEEEDILRPPDTSESESETEKASIKPSVFKTGSDDSNTTSKKMPNGRSKTAAAAKGSRSSARTNASTLQLSQSPKRKSQENIPSSSAKDMFGNMSSNKRAKVGYGSSQSKEPRSSQHSAPKSSQGVLLSPLIQNSC